MVCCYLKAADNTEFIDPDTIITKHQIKLIVYSGKIPIYTVGNRKFFDYDLFRSYIANPANYNGTDFRC